MAELPLSDEAERDRAIALLSDAGFDLVMRGKCRRAEASPLRIISLKEDEPRT